ncbi:MAG: RNA polymerase sigma factor [Candidatus Binatia bacterium]
MEDPRSQAREARELIGRCLAGDAQAVQHFQQAYGELIYGYPIRVYRTPPEDAGDFYVFAFQQGRIFRRLRTFEGRAPLRAYLLGSVLDDLVLEWKRGERRVETVSIERFGDVPDPAGPASQTAPEAPPRPGGAPSLNDMLATVPPSKAVVMKLLYVEDADLKARDIEYLADVSGRSVPEVLAAVAGMRTTVREREAGLKRLEDALEAVQAWIHLYERQLRRVSEDLAAVPAETVAAARLREEAALLEHKIRRRHQQRARLLAQAQRRKVTAPYKHIAALLNTSVGNVCSQIARLRKELLAKAGTRGQETGLEKRKVRGVGSSEEI